MGRFDKVDLGGDRAMQRMIAKAKEERDAVIEECAIVAEVSSPEVAKAIRALKG